METLDAGNQDAALPAGSSKCATPLRSVSTGGVSAPSASIRSTTGVRFNGSPVTFILP